MPGIVAIRGPLDTKRESVNSLSTLGLRGRGVHVISLSCNKNSEESGGERAEDYIMQQF